MRELIEFLFLTKFYTLSERLACAVDRKRNPYPAQFGTLDGQPWQRQIICGLNPYLFGRLVDDLVIECTEDGHETAVWKERQKADISWRTAPR